MGGRFVLSDDSHAVEHIGFGYRDALHYLEALNVMQITTCNPTVFEPSGAQAPPTQVAVEELWREPFFATA